MLAQRPITLVLMMINSSSYSTNDLVFIKIQIFNQDLSRYLDSTKNSKSSFEAITCDSRSHQVLKEESSSWIKSRWRGRFSKEDFQEDLSVSL